MTLHDTEISWLSHTTIYDNVGNGLMTQAQVAKKALAMKAKKREPLVVTVKEAGKRLGISEERAYAAAAAGQIPTITLGKRRAVPVAALERMLAEVKADGEAA
jgi:excisionase family DNA binding protein